MQLIGFVRPMSVLQKIFAPTDCDKHNGCVTRASRCGGAPALSRAPASAAQDFIVRLQAHAAASRRPRERLS